MNAFLDAFDTARRSHVPGRHYRIGEVARELGEKPHVLRYWETEFGVRTTRSKSGQRVYTPAQVAKLRLIRWLLHVELYTTAGAKRQLALLGEDAP